MRHDVYITNIIYGNIEANGIDQIKAKVIVESFKKNQEITYNGLERVELTRTIHTNKKEEKRKLNIRSKYLFIYYYFKRTCIKI